MIEWKLEVKVNGIGFEAYGTNKAHFKNEENELRWVRREINRLLKTKIEQNKN